MSDDFKLLAKLAADTTDFDSAMKRTAAESRQWATEAKQIFVSTRTPLEQYQAAVEKVHDAWRSGRIDTETFGRALAKLRGEFEKTTTVMAELAPQKAGPLSGLGTSLSGSLLGFSTGVGAVVAGTMLATRAIEGLAHAAAGAATQGIRLAAEFETAEITFRTLFKSASLAKEVMGQIKQFSAQTPFEFPEIKNAATQLAGFGVSAKQIVPTLKVLGDIAAGSGASVNELALTYGKARITGRAYTRDVMEFANRNVPVWQALNKVLGTTTSQTHKMVEEGKVGFAELQRAILSLVQDGGQFEGAMEDRAKGIEGLYSNLKDNITIALGDLGETLIQELDLKSVTQQLIDLTGVFRSDGVPVLIEFTKGLVTLADASNRALTVLTGIDLSTKGLTQTIYGARSAMLQWDLAMAKILGSEEQVRDIQKQLIDLGLRSIGLGPKPQAPGALEIESGDPAAELAASIGEVNAKLQKEIDLFGKSAAEKQLWELRVKGATEAQLAETKALLDQQEAQKKAAESAKEAAKAQKKAADDAVRAAKKQEDAQASLIKSLEGKLASLKGESVQNQLQQFEKEFGAGSVSQRAKDLQVQIDAAEKQKKLQKELADARKKDAEEAKRIIEETRTPYEKYAEEIYKIERLWKQGELTQEQAIRAAKKAQDEFISSGPEYTSENKAILRGSAEAFSTANRAKDRRKQEKIAEDQLSTLKRMEILSRQSVAAQQSVQRWESN